MFGDPRLKLLRGAVLASDFQQFIQPDLDRSPGGVVPLGRLRDFQAVHDGLEVDAAVPPKRLPVVMLTPANLVGDSQRKGSTVPLGLVVVAASDTGGWRDSDGWSVHGP